LRNEFTARTTVTKYCSHPCASRAYKARARQSKIIQSNTETVQTLSAPVIELQTKDFLTVVEACRLLNVSRWTLARAIKDERLKAVRLGKANYYQAKRC
jgi:excisionase family DNA binding protein